MHLIHYRNKGEWCCSRHMVSCMTSKTKKSIHDMEAQSFPTAEKFIAKASASKFMATVFWDEAGLLLVHIIHHGDCNCCMSLWYTLKGYSWSLVAEGQSFSASQSLISSIMPAPVLPTETVTGYSPMPGRLQTHHLPQCQTHAYSFHLFGPIMTHLAGKQSATLT